MNHEQQAKLRESFKPDQIGKLPKPTKKENPKGRCKECGGWHGLPAVHLDYVGHAAVTDRLLQVDPEWTWWPMALDERGAPMLDAKGGLWIYLKILDVQRPGYGDGDSMKEIIGDAIRNAAMRFGVALDLWAKEPLHAEEPPAAPTRAKKQTAAQKRIVIAASENGIDDELRYRITRRVTEGAATSSKDVPAAQVDRVVRSIEWYAEHPDESRKKLEEWEAQNTTAVA